MYVEPCNGIDTLCRLGTKTCDTLDLFSILERLEIDIGNLMNNGLLKLGVCNSIFSNHAFEFHNASQKLWTT